MVKAEQTKKFLAKKEYVSKLLQTDDLLEGELLMQLKQWRDNKGLQLFSHRKNKAEKKINQYESPLAATFLQDNSQDASENTNSKPYLVNSSYPMFEIQPIEAYIDQKKKPTINMNTNKYFAQQMGSNTKKDKVNKKL